MISIDGAILARIHAHGVRDYPNEACGVLLGALPVSSTQPRVVTRELPLGNSRESGEQYHRFVITPRDYLDAERRAGELGLDIVGFYHSHPDHPSVPSDYDRDHAFPGLSYIITAVEGKIWASPRAVRTQSWTLALDRSAFHLEADLGETTQGSANTAAHSSANEE
ncbi:Mov34/MPN/PAD-1 family protein [Propionibacterium sp.]|uniref:Mov34/MPN/PAD-1 family protein n=1 Tax=Propionibacterium sp. TaxID=1977903 RepID=UPI0039EB238A